MKEEVQRGTLELRRQARRERISPRVNKEGRNKGKTDGEGRMDGEQRRKGGRGLEEQLDGGM